MMICCMVLTMLMVTSCADARKQRMLNTPVEGILENGVRYEFIVEEFDLNEFLENNPIHVTNSLIGRILQTPSEVAEWIGLRGTFPSLAHGGSRDAEQYFISMRFCVATDKWVLFIKPVDADNVEYSGDASILRMVTVKHAYGRAGSINMFRLRMDCPYAPLYNEEFKQQILNTPVEGVLKNGVRYEFVGGEFNLDEFCERNDVYRRGAALVEPVIVRTPTEAAEMWLYHLWRSDLEPYFAYINLHIRFCSAENDWVVIFDSADIMDIIEEDSPLYYIGINIITFNYSTGKVNWAFSSHFGTQKIIW